MTMIQDETMQSLVDAVVSDPDGYSAWTNFLGYAPKIISCTPFEEEVTDVAHQMPEEELEKFLDYYGIEY